MAKPLRVRPSWKHFLTSATIMTICTRKRCPRYHMPAHVCLLLHEAKEQLKGAKGFCHVEY